MLRGENIEFTYGKGTPGECQVLKGINFDIQPGDFIGLIGASGSGKTTLIKLMNGLLKATSGDIRFQGESIYSRKYPISQLRKEVGLVFQYPEQQLFAKTVLQDAMYGPLNLGMSKEEARQAAVDSLELVGIGGEFHERSPFELSGGQKRCVAIAGILAMNPKVLVMDEPAAGLDPETKHMVFNLIKRIQAERDIAIVLVSHHMEDVAKYARQVWILNDGEIILRGTPKEVFSNVDRMKEIGVGVPQITSAMDSLRKSGIDVEVAVTVEEAEKTILKLLSRGEAE